jgi:hypothetical protein
MDLGHVGLVTGGSEPKFFATGHEAYGSQVPQVNGLTILSGPRPLESLLAAFCGDFDELLKNCLVRLGSMLEKDKHTSAEKKHFAEDFAKLSTSAPSKELVFVEQYAEKAAAANFYSIVDGAKSVGEVLQHGVVALLEQPFTWDRVELFKLLPLVQDGFQEPIAKHLTVATTEAFIKFTSSFMTSVRKKCKDALFEKNGALFSFARWAHQIGEALTSDQDDTGLMSARTS